MIKGAVQPTEVRDGKEGVRCIECGAVNPWGYQILHEGNCRCPFCGDAVQGLDIIWHKHNCYRSNSNSHFGVAMYDKPEDAAEDYWLIRAYLQGGAKINIAKAFGYKSSFKVYDVLRRYHID